MAALPMSAGSKPASAAKAVSIASSCTEEFDHSEHEPGLAAGGANLGRADAGCGEEAAEPLAIRGDEGKRLNCQRFRRFFRQG